MGTWPRGRVARGQSRCRTLGRTPLPDELAPPCCWCWCWCSGRACLPLLCAPSPAPLTPGTCSWERAALPLAVEPATFSLLPPPPAAPPAPGHTLACPLCVARHQVRTPGSWGSGPGEVSTQMEHPNTRSHAQGSLEEQHAGREKEGAAALASTGHQGGTLTCHHGRGRRGGLCVKGARQQACRGRARGRRALLHGHGAGAVKLPLHVVARVRHAGCAGTASRGCRLCALWSRRLRGGRWRRRRQSPVQQLLDPLVRLLPGLVRLGGHGHLARRLGGAAGGAGGALALPPGTQRLRTRAQGGRASERALLSMAVTPQGRCRHAERGAPWRRPW